MKAWAPPRGKVLVLAPHPDDETIGCGGAIVFHRRRGDPVVVVFATDGERGDPKGRYRGRGLAAVRRREARAAAKVLGVSRLEFWHFPDLGLARENELGPRLALLLKRERPDLVYRPALSDPHPDHRALDRAFRKASAAVPGVRDLAYEIYGGSKPGWFLDITPFFPEKIRALRASRSQLASTGGSGGSAAARPRGGLAAGTLRGGFPVRPPRANSRTASRTRPASASVRPG